MAESQREYIWVSRWEEFQTYTTKRGKPWVPPWIKIYPRLLDEPAFIDLSPETRMVLVGIWMLFGRTHGTIAIGTRSPHEGITWDTRSLSRQLSQRVTKVQLEALNHAGFILFCSGTVREQLWERFQNGSSPEVEVDTDKEVEQNQDQEPNPTPPVASYLPKELQPQPKNGMGDGERNNNGKDLEPIGETAAELIAKLRGAA